MIIAYPFIHDGWFAVRVGTDVVNLDHGIMTFKYMTHMRRRSPVQFGMYIGNPEYKNFQFDPLPYRTAAVYPNDDYSVQAQGKFRKFIENVNSWINGRWTITGVGYADEQMPWAGDMLLEFGFSDPEDAVYFKLKIVEE